MMTWNEAGPRPYRPRRNPYERTLRALSVTGSVVLLVLLVAAVVGYGWLVWHAYVVDAFDKIEVTKTVEVTKHPGLVAGVVFGLFAAFGAVVGLVTHVGYLVEKAKKRAREWERRQPKDD